jgi:hypothetical protein
MKQTINSLFALLNLDPLLRQHPLFPPTIMNEFPAIPHFFVLVHSFWVLGFVHPIGSVVYNPYLTHIYIHIYIYIIEILKDGRFKSYTNIYIWVLCSIYNFFHQFTKRGPHDGIYHPSPIHFALMPATCNSTFGVDT